MAIDFGNTIMEGGITPSVAVQNPVEDNSGAVLAQAFAPAAEWAGKVAGNIFAQQSEDGKYRVLNNYETESYDIIDAYEQGTMSQQEAKIRLRDIRSQYLANAPSLRDDFDKVWGNLTEAGGFGHVVVEGTVADRAQEAIDMKAAELGYTPEQFSQFQANARVLEAYKQQLDLVTSQNGIVTETQKARGLEYITNVAASAVPAAQQMTNATIAAIDAAPDATSKAAAVTQYNLQIGNSIASLEGQSFGVDTTYITKPMKDLQAMVAAYSTGAATIEQLEAEKKYTSLIYNQMQMKDPKVAAFLATSALMKEVGLSDNPAVQQHLFDAEVINRMAEIDQGTANLLNGTAASNKALEALGEAAATPNLSEAAAQEIMTGINLGVDGVYLNERSIKDPLGYKQMIETLALPAIGELISTNGLDAEHVDQFADVIARNYETVLGPAIQQFWQEQDVSSIEDIYFTATGSTQTKLTGPMNQFLEPVWNGSAVEFVPKAEYATNPSVVALAGKANTGDSSIGVPLNNLINAIANTTGQDAKALWESNYAQKWFGITEEGETTPEATTPLTEFQNESFTFEEMETDQGSSVSDATLPPLPASYADTAGIDFASYLPSIRASESGGNDRAANPTSTALGRYQFLKGTWNGLVSKYPDSGLTSDGRTDPGQQEIAIRLFTAENARYLKSRGIGLNNGTLYAAHFLGANDAAKVLSAGPSEPLSNYISAAVINANSFLRGMNVQEFKAWAQRKGNA